jgi:hypothetical protein
MHAAPYNNRWTVSHYTATGKPDVVKKQARARPLDAAYAITDPIIAAQHATFTGGDVDLFAFDRDHNDSTNCNGVSTQRQQQQKQQHRVHTADRSSLNRVVEQVCTYSCIYEHCNNLHMSDFQFLSSIL